MRIPHVKSRPAAICASAAIVALALTSFVRGVSAVSPAGPKFYPDDPAVREVESQDASAVQERDINLFVDLTLNMFTRPGDRAEGVRARNLNTIDEVPDSNWFTNRILARPVTIEEAARGPLSGSGPASGTLTIVRAKQSGDAPGFTVRDTAGETWFVSFDARGYPEAATGALLVANKIFWTLGYWQVENYLATIHSDSLAIADSATVRPESGVRRKMTRADVDAILKRAHRGVDGSYRAVAARAIPGRTLAGFLYYGTRSDDPNDIVEHEHRRELRALKVFGAWTNLVDLKAGNTLDTLIQQDGKRVVRHYLQDVGSAFGTGANGQHEYFEGWEHLVEGGRAVTRLMSFGFFLQPWQTVDYPKHDAIGVFEGDLFDPAGWKPRVPTAAFLHAMPDDTFWAARRVMAFSDAMIQAIASTGGYSDPASARYLADVLIKRRDAIGRAFLPAVNPISNPVLDETGTLVFENPAVVAGVAAAPDAYRGVWFTFDNTTADSRRIGESSATSTQLKAPVALTTTPGSMIKVELSATASSHAQWARPVTAYFLRELRGWRLVGFERVPQS